MNTSKTKLFSASETILKNVSTPLEIQSLILGVVYGTNKILKTNFFLAISSLKCFWDTILQYIINWFPINVWAQFILDVTQISLEKNCLQNIWLLRWFQMFPRDDSSPVRLSEYWFRNEMKYWIKA